jgi:xanthine dehydrogenase molybdopterin-binding subunit B
MEITAQEAFKLGFLARCAEEKLAGAELEARLDKIAEFNKQAAGLADLVNLSPINFGLGSLGGAATTTLSGLAQLYAVPPAAAIMGGAGLGYGAAKMVEPRIDEDEMKAQELATTYKLYAEKAKNRKKLRQYRLGHTDA